MIQNLRQIKGRIRSVESTKKITRAMEMVSAAKLNKVKSALYPSRAYFAKLDAVVRRLLSGSEGIEHPFLEKREETGAVALCVITSEAGLCGAYNYTVISAAEEFIKRYGRDRVTLVVVGKEGFNHFKRMGYNIATAYMQPHGSFLKTDAEDIAGFLMDSYLEGDVDEVFIAYTRFDTTLHHKVMLDKLLSIDIGKEKAGSVDYITEPDIKGVLDLTLKMYITEKVRMMLLGAFTSEHSARMVAMKAATDNAEELIDTLTLMRNKARQAAITREMIEIASTAEALKE